MQGEKMLVVKRLPLGPIGANCYILCDEKSGEGAVIDVGGFEKRLLDEISGAGIKNLKYILCTHGHFDHISGIPELKKHFPSAEILIDKDDKDLFFDGEKNLADYFGAVSPHFKADGLLFENEELFLGETKLRVMKTPGHSRGSVCFICDKEKIVFSGDTLFKFTVGRTDLWGGSLEELSKSLEKIMTLPDDYKVYTGHNIPTTVGDERTGNRFFRKR